MTYTAIHEAAHAIAALTMGFTVTSVAIYPDGSGLTQHCGADDRHRELVTTACGPLAELSYHGCRFDPWDTGNAGSDNERWEGLLRDLPGPRYCDRDGGERGRAADAALTEAKRIVRERRADIHRLADVLYQRGRMTGDEVCDVLGLPRQNHRPTAPSTSPKRTYADLLEEAMRDREAVDDDLFFTDPSDPRRPGLVKFLADLDAEIHSLKRKVA